MQVIDQELNDLVHRSGERLGEIPSFRGLCRLQAQMQMIATANAQIRLSLSRSHLFC